MYIMDLNILSAEDEYYGEYLDLLNQTQRRSALFFNKRLRTNPLDQYREEEVVARFRFSKATIMELLQLISPELKTCNFKDIDIDPILQLLLTLRFYATGTFQLVCGDLQNISQPSASKIIKKVSQAIASKRHQFINYPNEDQAKTIRKSFLDLSEFPDVVGAIDCTHVKITSPGGQNAELFRNRKSYFSINVQAVCDSELMFTNVVARWPGSVHDSKIFDNCLLRAQLGNDEVPKLLLGDMGYPCLTYLLTPLDNPITEAQKRYNKAHSKARNIVERAFGVLKRRFFCLGSSLRTKLSTSLTIIVACFVLHNLARLRNEPEPDGDLATNDTPVVPSTGSNSAGSAFRAAFILKNFTRS